MYGYVETFDAPTATGVIVSERRQQYRFALADVVNADELQVGAECDFVLIDGQPKDIISMCGMLWTAFGPGARSLCEPAAASGHTFQAGPPRPLQERAVVASAIEAVPPRRKASLWLQASRRRLAA